MANAPQTILMAHRKKVLRSSSILLLQTLNSYPCHRQKDEHNESDDSDTGPDHDPHANCLQTFGHIGYVLGHDLQHFGVAIFFFGHRFFSLGQRIQTHSYYRHDETGDRKGNHLLD